MKNAEDLAIADIVPDTALDSGPGTNGESAYRQVAEAIRFLRVRTTSMRERGSEVFAQPSLAEIAAHVGLSEFHLQRLFSAWVGISPKRFLQYLTKEYAKEALRASANVLDASLEAGLSSPGRLHDLMVTCEGVTPGEYGTHGEGLDIRYGIHATPFGDALIALTSRGVCRVEFIDDTHWRDALRKLSAEWPAASLLRSETSTAAIAASMFAGPAYPGRLHLLVKGSNYQIQVWQALLRIPPGSVTTYQRIAQLLGNGQAARAVGNAVGANPVAWLIPCHRVIRETGEMGGYRWGVERKQAMLAWEASHLHEGQRESV